MLANPTAKNPYWAAEWSSHSVTATCVASLIKDSHFTKSTSSDLTDSRLASPKAFSERLDRRPRPRQLCLNLLLHPVQARGLCRDLVVLSFCFWLRLINMGDGGTGAALERF